MPLIAQVGRRSLKTRALILTLYLALSIGAVTMVVPFLLMLSTSLTSGVDQNDYAIIPRFLYSRDALYRKYIEDKYYGNIDQVNGRNATAFATMEDVTPPTSDEMSHPEIVAIWDRLTADLPNEFWEAGFRGYMNGPSLLTEWYQQETERRFRGHIAALNERYLEENVSFQTVLPPNERLSSRGWTPGVDAKSADWKEMRRNLPTRFRLPVRADLMYQDHAKGLYRGVVADINAAWGTKYTDIAGIRMPRTPPLDPEARADWVSFVREKLPYRYLRLLPASKPHWNAFLRTKYRGDLAKLNEIHQTTASNSYSRFGDIPVPEDPSEAVVRVDFTEFLKTASVEWIRIDTVESRFEDSLAREFGTVANMNRRLFTKFASFASVAPPEATSDRKFARSNFTSLRNEFAGRNFRLVYNYIFLHGRAVVNTVVYCALAVLTALIVNPLCAYALSRYPMRSTYRILLVILATMAFPAEVTMIPNFLLLKQFGLLNTFWALILPVMAGPFMIFLLKGFFDSLPKELFEAGLIDGASELVMFWKVTIPLSKPIFAVIALQAFTAAYGAFMFAFLVCQDQRMWTMMVWLYQLQIHAPKYVTMAALTVAAIPTLVIFILAQNVILRGIIIPTSK